MEGRFEKLTKMFEEINNNIDILYSSFRNLMLEANSIDKNNVKQLINDINEQVNQYRTSLSLYRCMCGHDDYIQNLFDLLEKKLKFVICEIELLAADKIILDLKDVNKL